MESAPSTQNATVHCPVCSAICTGEPLYRYTAQQAADYFCSATRNQDRNARLRACIERIWGNQDCQVLRCGECGFGFGHPFAGGDDEFYAILHEQRGYPSWRWDYDVAIEKALRNTTPGRILDVGAGQGAFLKGLDSGWERFAVEGSETTRGELEASGIQVFRDLAQAADEAQGTFQVVTFFQSLEHIADFAPVLSQVRRLLAPGGKIVVTVPDGDAMIRQEELTGCPDMPPNHICKWTPKSLAVALRQAGFQPGDGIPEAASWKNLMGAMHLRVGAVAANERSLCAQIYRIPVRTLRIPFLAVAGAALSLRLLPHLRELSRGGAFAMIGSAV